MWIADSRATQHMTSRKERFSDLHMIHDDRFVYIANNEKLRIHSFGTIHIKALVKNIWCARTLTNVQYVQNVFTTVSTTSKGFSIVMEANSYVLMDKDQNILAAGVKDSINQFRMLFETQTHQTANLAKIDYLQKWHCRLGHINATTIKNMGENNVADGINLLHKNNFF